jgi:hypothetical protein
MPRTLFFSLLCVLLLACTGQPGAPTSSPGHSPAPTDGPTSTPAPSPSPTLDPDQIAHPTGPTDIVLQYAVAGGFVTPDMVVTQVPQFTLYGDGTVIWQSRDGGGPQGIPPLLRGRMDEELVQALLAFALDQGRLAVARDHYFQNSCADCQTTTFRINAGGIDKTVSIDALGIEEQMDRADRVGFMQLAEWLGNFDDQVRNGAGGDIQPYDPSHYLVVLTQAVPEMGAFGDWPWSRVSVDDFRPRGEGDWQREARLTSDDVALITAVPTGGTMGVLVEDPAGGLWSVALRPLLPDEIADAG